MSYVLDDTKVRADKAAALSFKIMPSSVFGNRMPKQPNDPKTARIPHDLSRSTPPPSQVAGFGQYIASSTFTKLHTTPFDNLLKPNPKHQFNIPSVGVLGTPTNSPEEITPKNKFMTRIKSIIDALKIAKPDSSDLIWLGSLYLVLQYRMPNSGEIKQVEDLEITIEPMLKAHAEAVAAAEAAEAAAKPTESKPEPEAEAEPEAEPETKPEPQPKPESSSSASSASASSSSSSKLSKQQKLRNAAEIALDAIVTGHTLSEQEAMTFMSKKRFDSLKAVTGVSKRGSLTKRKLETYLKSS